MSAQRCKNRISIRRGAVVGSAIIVSAVAFACLTSPVKADEGGVSFWLPGLFGSLAAVPQQPGWSLTSVYYHTSVSAGADVSRAREFQIGKIPVNLTANVSAKLDARADLAFALPTYTFATPVFGGQLSVGAIGIYGRVDTSLAGTVTGALATPLGTFPFSRSDSISDSVTGFGDVWPIATLKLEQRRSQLHDLYDRRHPGRRLRFGAAVEHRHRPRRDRRRRRLYLFQSGRPGTNSQACSASPTISRTSRPSIRTASTCISIGARRSS